MKLLMNYYKHFSSMIISHHTCCTLLDTASLYVSADVTAVNLCLLFIFISAVVLCIHCRVLCRTGTVKLITQRPYLITLLSTSSSLPNSCMYTYIYGGCHQQSCAPLHACQIQVHPQPVEAQCWHLPNH